MRLRDIKESDFTFLKRLTSQEDIMRYVGNGKIWNDKKINNFIKYNLAEQKQDYKKREEFYYIVQDDDKNVGIIGVHLVKDKYNLTVFFYKTSQRKGYFKKALDLIVKRIKNYKPKLEKIYSQVRLNNDRMLDIMRKNYYYEGKTKIGSVTLEEFIIFTRKNTFKLFPYYYDRELLKGILNSYGWKEAYKGESVDFLYVEGLNVFKKNTFGIECIVKNTSNNNDVTSKSYIYDAIRGSDKKYVLESHRIDINNLDILDDEKIWVIKPDGAYKGDGIIFTSDKKIMKKHIEKNKEYSLWLAQEYITNPRLIDQKKFHIRCHLISWGDRLFYFKLMPVVMAKEMFSLTEFKNKDIHDTHYHPEQKPLYFPDIITDEEDKINIIKQIEDLYKDLKEITKAECWPESQHCYNLLGVDLMITETNEVKILEVNNRVGLKPLKDNPLNYGQLLFEAQTQLVLGHYFHIKNNDKLHYLIEV